MSISVQRNVALLVLSALPILLLWFYGDGTLSSHAVSRVSSLFSASVATAYCLPPGSLLPPPKVLSDTPKLKLPSSTFTDKNWLSDTSFAIKASIGDVTVYKYEHSSPGREVGQSLLDTSFRVASITKMFTMLAILLSGNKVKLSDPITKFIPELNEDVYGQVTIAALASHTSGLGRFIYTGDLAIVPGFRPAALGLPNINNTGVTRPTCDLLPGGRVCTREQLISGLNDPAYYPRTLDSGPLYSNIGYTLLGMALEAVHHRSTEQVVHDLITEPLGLSRTTFTVQTDPNTAIIPRLKADGGWFVPDFGNYNPSGGLWSTPNDILTFLQAILSHQLLNAHETRRWLQPRAALPSLHQAVGESWEILRPTDLDVKTPRPIEIFTKTGGVTGYAAYAAIIPEYDIALTINAGGAQAQDVVSTIFPLLVKPLVAYADRLAHEQCAIQCSGTYKDLNASSYSSLTLAIDNGPGLAITDLVVNGVPVLPSLAAVQKISIDKFSARLYPYDLGPLGSEKEIWKLVIGRSDRQNGFAELQCASWFMSDAFRYATEPLDVVVFTRNVHGLASVELLGWRVTLNRA